jgi:hypothetical protein
MRHGYENDRRRPFRSSPSSRLGSIMLFTPCCPRIPFREALTSFLKAGHLDASNNYAERCMRPVAVGRKAFLFVGSERAGHAAASYHSLVESCKANKVNPLAYLTYVHANARNKSIMLPTPDEFAASSIADVG